MIKKLFLSLLILTFISCKSDKKDQENSTAGDNTEVETDAAEVVEKKAAYVSIGEKFSSFDAVSASDMASRYDTMKAGDTVYAKMVAKVDEVCQAKGCWMKLDLENGEQVMVKFKDYGFFMPKDIAGKEVIINGLAFIEEMSVDDQKHYAKDAGESEEGIAAIVAPKKTYSFEADGVLLKN